MSIITEKSASLKVFDKAIEKGTSIGIFCTGSYWNTEAILLARTAGVNVVVSAHARAYSELCKNKNIKRLIDENIFGAAYQITESGHEVIYLATWYYYENFWSFTIDAICIVF